MPPKGRQNPFPPSHEPARNQPVAQELTVAGGSNPAINSCSNIQQLDDGALKLCEGTAKMLCGGCTLVQYCSKECQHAHWKMHRIHCQAPLFTDYKPFWELDKRSNRLNLHLPPTYINFDRVKDMQGRTWFWSDLPAFDVLNMEANEGTHYEKDLAILFASSGDLRNVVETIINIPDTCSSSIEIFINDHTFDLAARNTILLLIAMAYEPKEAGEIMIHFWYSIFMPRVMLDSVKQRLLRILIPIISQQKAAKTDAEDDSPKTLLEINKSKISSNFTATSLERLTNYLKLPRGKSTELISAWMKDHVETAPRDTQTMDRVDRRYVLFSPQWRTCLHKFREDGVLLPFASDRSKFDTPNPSFFQKNDPVWPIFQHLEPWAAWRSHDYANFAPVATGDLLGSVYFLLKKKFTLFSEKLHTRAINLTVASMSPWDLARAHHIRTEEGRVDLERPLYDRIDGGILADEDQLGPKATLRALLPLLKNSQAHFVGKEVKHQMEKHMRRVSKVVESYENSAHRHNPHATLITTHSNWLSNSKSFKEAPERLVAHDPSSKLTRNWIELLHSVGEPSKKKVAKALGLDWKNLQNLEGKNPTAMYAQQGNSAYWHAKPRIWDRYAEKCKLAWMPVELGAKLVRSTQEDVRRQFKEIEEMRARMKREKEVESLGSKLKDYHITETMSSTIPEGKDVFFAESPHLSSLMHQSPTDYYLSFRFPEEVVAAGDSSTDPGEGSSRAAAQGSAGAAVAVQTQERHRFKGWVRGLFQRAAKPQSEEPPRRLPITVVRPADQSVLESDEEDPVEGSSSGAIPERAADRSVLESEQDPGEGSSSGALPGRAASPSSSVVTTIHAPPQGTHLAGKGAESSSPIGGAGVVGASGGAGGVAEVGETEEVVEGGPRWGRNKVVPAWPGNRKLEVTDEGGWAELRRWVWMDKVGEERVCEWKKVEKAPTGGRQ
ncbi:MAG: hypothetical protein M1831_007051 [Alyxoria varia]|nr:MAG: hypothetical protein M1831_007051 [Alyxoria varia]